MIENLNLDSFKKLIFYTLRNLDLDWSQLSRP